MIGSINDAYQRPTTSGDTLSHDCRLIGASDELHLKKNILRHPFCLSFEVTAKVSAASAVPNDGKLAAATHNSGEKMSSAQTRALKHGRH